MNFAYLFPYLPILGCAISMALMMWMMSRNMGGHAGHGASMEQPSEQRLAMLRDQRKALDAEIGELTRIVELEQERERVLAGPPAGVEPPVSYLRKVNQ